MDTRPIRALLGAVTLAALAITTTTTSGPPAGAGDKVPPCPAQPKVIVSNAHDVVGTPCDDIIFPGPTTDYVHALEGDDVVTITGPPAAVGVDIYVELGTGDDQVSVLRAIHANVRGGPGADTMRADSLVPKGILYGEAGDDVMWTGSSKVGLLAGADDDRLEVTAASTPDPPNTSILQTVDAGSGDDLVITEGATGPRKRSVREGPGDDTYRLRHPASAGGQDRLWVDDDASGTDIALLDPADHAPIAHLGAFETLLVAWG